MNIHHEVEELNDIYADIRGLRHDLRGHINNIAAYVRQIAPKNCNELETYIEGMENTVSRLDFADSTGNPISDIIIHQSRQRANRNNIKFNVDFHYPKAGDFDVYDVSIILNNALQNAFEACEKIENGSKNISIRSYTKGSLFFVEVENNFNGELKPIANSDIFATTKEKSQLHGVGLVNIKRCAQKYNGDLDIQVTDIQGGKIFCLTVMLYGKNLKSD